MNWFSLTPKQLAGAQIALAAVLAVAGFVFLLPRPRGRAVKEGVAALIAAAAVLGTWLYTAYGRPMPDLLGTILFCFFSLGALGFGTVLVVHPNPARGAIAFAFVILSTCGLFLLLAAPFLMAATVIIYAGAIIVTFLFVLMLSQAAGPSDENDRSREPLFGGLAGFAFTGLVLFTLYLTQTGNSPARAGEGDNALPRGDQRLPAPVLTPEEHRVLADAGARLDTAAEQLDALTTPAERERVAESFDAVHDRLGSVVGLNGLSRDGSIRSRLEQAPARGDTPAVLYRGDAQAKAALGRAASVRDANEKAYKALLDHTLDGKPDLAAVKAAYRDLREDVLLLRGSGELPARNVGNLGYLLYADHLLAVELAGTLLLVATIGAVAIAHRRRDAA